MVKMARQVSKKDDDNDDEVKHMILRMRRRKNKVEFGANIIAPWNRPACRTATQPGQSFSLCLADKVKVNVFGVFVRIRNFSTETGRDYKPWYWVVDGALPYGFRQPASAGQNSATIA